MARIPSADRSAANLSSPAFSSVGACRVLGIGQQMRQRGSLMQVCAGGVWHYALRMPCAPTHPLNGQRANVTAGSPRSSPGNPPTQDPLGPVLTRSAAGDDRAFAQVYDATAGPVYGLILRVVRSPQLAAEVVQEVYLMAWQQAERFDPDRGTVMSWLCTMAHRRAVDHVRSSQRRREREERYETELTGRPSDETWGEVEQILDTEQIREGLAALSPRQREAVDLVYFRGMSHREVAEHLELPLGTAKARIRDGLRALRAAWGEPA